MPAELQATAIAGMLELVSQSFADHRGSLLAS